MKETALLDHAWKLSAASTEPRSVLKVVEGADYFYTGRHGVLAQLIDQWLNPNLSP